MCTVPGTVPQNVRDKRRREFDRVSHRTRLPSTMIEYKHRLLPAPTLRKLCMVLRLLCLLACCMLAVGYVVLWRYLFWLTQTMPKSSVRDFRIARRQRLLFCSIEKNANSAFSDLICSLDHSGAPASRPSWWQHLAARFRSTDDFELGCSWQTTSPVNLGMTEEQVWDAFESDTWTTAVFLRDPLERFLSGYISKCTGS